MLRAVAAGQLPAARLESQRKLKLELRSFERRHEVRAQFEERRRGRLKQKQIQGRGTREE